MAETSCLRRSFSSPSEITLDFSQGDPARVLGESISFGRYMSESLAWEKWSAFTSNRYLEEAEKYSKPGSVAKMKAYFEAHYGRFGAKKRAAQEQANNKGCRLDAEDVPNTDSILSSVFLNPVNSCESHAVDNPDVDILSSGIVDTYSSPTQPIDVENEGGSSVESVAVADVVSCLPEVEVHQSQVNEVDASVIERSVENDYVKDVEKIDVITPPECTVTVKIDVEHEKVEKKKLESICEQKLDDYCVRRLKKTNLSKLSSSISRLATPVHSKKDGNITPNSKVSKLSSSFTRLTTPVHSKKEGNGTPNTKLAKLSSSFTQPTTPLYPKKEGHVTPNSKVTKLSSSFARLATSTHPRKESHITPTRRMLEKVSLDKQKLAPNTSMNISSDINVTKNPSSATRKVGFGKVFTPLGKIIRDSFSSSSTPSRASVNSVSRYPPATPQSEIKRSRVALEKSFDRSRRLDQKLMSPCVANSKSATPSPATFASFSFRTEERAAKRKELMQKRLEKEAEYFQQIESAKVKPTPDNQKSSQSRNLKANAAAYIRTEVFTDNTKKIPPPRLHLPKSESKSASDSARDKSFRPPQMTTGSKPSLESKKAFPSHLMVKTKGHENASPNIL